MLHIVFDSSEYICINLALHEMYIIPAHYLIFEDHNW